MPAPDSLNVEEALFREVFCGYFMKFHSYHFFFRQDLYGNDFRNHVEFCERVGLQNDEMFCARMLCTADATRHQSWWRSFSWYALLRKSTFVERSGKTKTLICQWLDWNSSWSDEWSIFHSWYVEIYATILTDFLSILLENVPLNIRQQMWYLHDGRSAHSTRAITVVLNREFGNRWIHRSGNNKQPTRSPDLTPLDFYFWGRLMNLLYNETHTTREDIKHRISRACALIDADEIHHAVRSIWTRIERCIHAQSHFEHLLWR